MVRMAGKQGDKMRFPKTCKVGSVASKAASRYTINSAWLDVEHSVVVETDGWVLSVVPVELDPEDTTGLVSVQALDAARKGSRKLHPDAEIKCNGGLEVPEHGQTFVREEAASVRFPDYRGVLPKAGAGSLRLGLNAVFLANLANSLGSDTLFLEFSPDEKGGQVGTVIRVEAMEGSGYGAIMPVVSR